MFFSALLLCFFTYFRDTKKKWVISETRKKLQSKKYAQNLESDNFDQKTEVDKLNFRNKLNEVFYWIASQMTFWLVLPLLCAIAADFLLSNSSFRFVGLES